jgi:hypothetical protein
VCKPKARLNRNTVYKGFLYMSNTFLCIELGKMHTLSDVLTYFFITCVCTVSFHIPYIARLPVRVDMSA